MRNWRLQGIAHKIRQRAATRPKSVGYASGRTPIGFQNSEVHRNFVVWISDPNNLSVILDFKEIQLSIDLKT